MTIFASLKLHFPLHLSFPIFVTCGNTSRKNELMKPPFVVNGLKKVDKLLSTRTTTPIFPAQGRQSAKN